MVVEFGIQVAVSMGWFLVCSMTQGTIHFFLNVNIQEGKVVI
jgi:hypothetical protein